jgi:thiosulfate reductase cytochrome b subunit
MSTQHDPRGLYLYTRFERLWHWTQAAAILVMLVSGFAVHGSFGANIDYRLAATVHVYAALVLMVIWIFAIFWHLTTGQWRHYIPTLEKLGKINRYYLIGIFKGEKHPAQKTPMRKHNALQRLVYLVMQAVVSPIIWVSGLLYLTYFYWYEVGGGGLQLETVAVVHTAAAFAFAIFLVGHVYMVFTAKPILAYMKAMITGYETAHDEIGTPAPQPGGDD